MLFVGDDWAEDHHDVFVEDSEGRRLAAARLVEGVGGVARFHELVAQAAGNQTLASLLGSMSSRTMRARIWHGVREAGASAAAVSQHAEILNALRARDPKMAYAAAVLHVGSTQAWFRQIVDAAALRHAPVPGDGWAEPQQP